MSTATATRTAGDVMSRDLLTVPETMTASELALFFAEHEISGAPVIDSRGDAVGVVSTFDLARLAAEEVDWAGESRELFYRSTPLDEEVAWELYGLESPGSLPPEGADTLVRDFMTPVVQSVSSDTDLAEVARLMVGAHYHRIFVHDGGGLIGVVSSMDLLGALAEEIDRRG